jgi:serine/threonine protein kinase
MLHEQQQCDPVVKSQFLSDQLSADEQRAFEKHLESCKHCRDELATVAAEQDLWNEVRETLGSEPSLCAPAEASLSSSAESAVDEKGSACDAVLALLKPTDHPNMLGRFGGYEIVAVIGQGGMGVVLKGFDPSLNRYVAIKVLAPHLAASGAARKRFSREAQAAAAVVHDNVVAIHSVSEDNGHPYLVMPYERGRSLQKRLDEAGTLSVVEVLRIGKQAAAGLAAAHVQGIVHRDIKPANILLDEGVERIKLTDFGLARAADDASLTKTGVIAGTPQFMSPEQARGDTIAATSDLFSLGSVMYTMCTGRPPFRAETSYGMLRRITDTEPRQIHEVNPDVPEWLCAIIAKLMAKRSEDRFASAGDVAELLEDCLAHVQQPATAPLPASLVAQSSSTRSSSITPSLIGVITMFAALSVAFLGMFIWDQSSTLDNSRINESRDEAHTSNSLPNDSIALDWRVLRKRFFIGDDAASTRPLADGSTLFASPGPRETSWRMLLDPRPAFDPGNGAITHVRFQALNHDSLPQGGPGRSQNSQDGSFRIFSLKLYHLTEAENHHSGGKLVRTRGAWADHQDASHPIDAAIDDRDGTSWIAPSASHPHAPVTAIFELDKPLQLAPEDSLAVEVNTGYRDHSTPGRVRISVAVASPGQSERKKANEEKASTEPARATSQPEKATSKPRTYSKDFAGKQWKDVFDWLAELTDCTVNYRLSTEFAFEYQSPRELTLDQVLRFIQVQSLKDELLLVFDEKDGSFRVEIAYKRFRRAEPEWQVGRRIGDFFKVVEYRLEPSNHYPDGLAPPALVYRLEALKDFSAGELRSALETSFRKGEFTRLSDGRLVDAEGWHVGPTDEDRSLPNLQKGHTIRLWMSWGMFYKGNFVSAITPGPRSFLRRENASKIVGQDRTSSKPKSDGDSLATSNEKERLPNAEAMIAEAMKLRKTIGELNEHISASEAILKHNPRADDFGGITARMENARRNLKAYRDELATRIRLLELQVAHAPSEVEAKRAQILLELYRKADSSKNVAKEPQSADAKSKGSPNEPAAANKPREIPARPDAPFVDEITEPVWGEAVNGIQLGISGIPQNSVYHPGEQIRFALHLRNASNETRHVLNYWPKNLGKVIAPMIETAAGERVEYPYQPRVRGGHHKLQYTLKPGETAVVDLQGTLTIGEEGEKFPGKLPHERCWCALSPGHYRVRGGFLLTPVDPAWLKPQGKPFSLTSGKVGIQITDREEGSPRASESDARGDTSQPSSKPKTKIITIIPERPQRDLGLYVFPGSDAPPLSSKSLQGGLIFE